MILDQRGIAVACACKCVPDEDAQSQRKARACSTINSHSSHFLAQSEALHAYLSLLAPYSSKVPEIRGAIPFFNASYHPADLSYIQSRPQET